MQNIAIITNLNFNYSSATPDAIILCNSMQISKAPYVTVTKRDCNEQLLAVGAIGPHTMVLS